MLTIYCLQAPKMYNQVRSLSDPELYLHIEDTSSLNIRSLPTEDSRESAIWPHRFTRSPILITLPSRFAFLVYVYFLFGCQVLCSVLQCLLTTYRWRPAMNKFERGFYMMIMLFSWLNLTLSFFGFRRLQISFPYNWIIFSCVFECLTLFAIFLCLLELDLTWPIIAGAVIVHLIYMPLGLWEPKNLPENIWILILVSLSIFITAIIALITNLALHIYVPLTVSMMFFGPWAMYNVQDLHRMAYDEFARYRYLAYSTKFYITYGFTIVGLVVANRFAYQFETDQCKKSIFCPREIVGLSFVDLEL